MIKVVITVLFIFNILACEPLQQASTRGTTQPTPNFTCLTTQSECDIESEFGRFNILLSGEMAQGRIKTELPFQVQIRLDAINKSYKLKQVISYLEGKDMFMGKIPVFFKPEPSNANVWVAQSLLASCSEKQMTWRLWLQVEIIVEGQVKQQGLFIDFESERL